MSPVAADERASADFGDVASPRAGFWRRFGGLCIDGLIISVIFVLLGVLLRLAFKDAVGPLGLLVTGAYWTLFVGARGQTPGMSALGIRVISLDGTGPIGYGRAFIRWIGSYLSALVFYLGFFWMLWDRERQCWHDKLASDVVVRVRVYR